MTTQRIREITPFKGNQIIIWIGPEHDDSQAHNHAVRVPINEAPLFIAQFQTAYANVMQNVAIELAAGGCRTCKNKRQVPDQTVFMKWNPCPNCIPRAEARIKKAAYGLETRDGS